VNISSPNTPGLRGLQNREELTRLVSTVLEARGAARKPVLVKIAPDLDDTALDEIAGVALMSGIDGLIVSNTTIARPVLKSAHAGETGGLSGAPLLLPSTKILRGVRQRVGNRITLIGAGGIASGADAYAKIRAGASLVQLYSALVFEGPGLVARIKSELAECLTRDGYDSIAEAVGVDV
jgi:dihydroorotate dehydrogenase